MKLFKDVAVGESFVLHNGQQLIRISPLTAQSHNCLDYPWYQKRFAITDDTECLTVDELMGFAEPLTMENSEEVEPKDVLGIIQKHTSNEFQTTMLTAFDKFDWAAFAAEDARQKQEAIDRNDWVVETKITDGGVTVEVSAVIEGSHGHKSWGWHGEHKQIVLKTSKTYGEQLPVSRAMLDLAEDEARRICRQKNK